MDSKKEKFVTIVSLSSALFDENENLKPIGGAENQLVMLANEIARFKSFRVSLLAFGKKSYKKYYNNILLNIINKKNPLILRSIYFIYRILNEKSDVIITRAGSPFLFIIGLATKVKATKLVYFLAHDWELVYGKKFTGWRWKLFHLGLGFCDQIFVQNSFQLKNIKKISSVNEKNLFLTKNLPLLEHKDYSSADPKYFLWVGTYRKHKMLEIFIKAAKSLPDYEFLIVIGMLGNKNAKKEIKYLTKDTNNLKIIFDATRQEILNIYHNAKALIITSKGEGFPNVAIEAWSQGKVVISSPNNALIHMNGYEGCFIYKNFKELLTYLKKEEKFYIKNGSSGYQYFLNNYGKNTIMKKIISAI